MTATATKSKASTTSEKKVISTTKFTLAQSVGDRIKWARERQKLTQVELAKLVGKSRASVVQYEQDRIAAPVSVLEVIADKLNVSPEFLAFGRAGIPGVTNAEEEIQAVNELVTRDGKLLPNGGWAIPREMFAGYGARDSELKMVHLGVDEPGFEMHRGDRVMIDTSASVSKDGLYLVETGFGARVVRIVIGLSSKSGVKVTNGVDGGDETIDPKQLKVVGMVIGAFRRCY
jgi:transcriptional regulator with XRE-family HTH domain